MHGESICNPEENKKRCNGQKQVREAVSEDVSSALEEADSQCEAVDKNTESQSRGGLSQPEEQKGDIRICHERDTHGSRCHLTRQMDRGIDTEVSEGTGCDRRGKRVRQGRALVRAQTSEEREFLRKTTVSKSVIRTAPEHG